MVIKMKKLKCRILIISLCCIFIGCGTKQDLSEESGEIVDELIDEVSNEETEEIEEEIQEKDISVNYADSGIIFTVDTALENEEYTITQLPWPCFWGGAAYSIQTNDGKLIIIDGGFMADDGEKIKEYVNENGGVVDDWIITHPHVDHVGAFIYNANADDPITINHVYYAPFTEEYFNDEDPDVATFLQNATLFTEFNQALEEHQIASTAMEQGDVLTYDSLTIECISGFKDEVKDVNANSLVMKFTIADFTMLFTGDMTEETLSYIQADYETMDVDFLQIPHHGYMAGIHGQTLYEYTTPEYAFLDCTVEEYDNNSVNIQDHVQLIENLDIQVIKRFEGVNQIIVK